VLPEPLPFQMAGPCGNADCVLPEPEFFQRA